MPATSCLVEGFEGNDALLFLWVLAWEDTDWGKQRGGNTEGAPKKDFGTIPYYFLEIGKLSCLSKYLCSNTEDPLLPTKQKS